MTGVLYIVATPIGNLDDISLRAIATLKAVDLIAAEDTRHSRMLLNHCGIGTRMISCHEHNESSRCDEIIKKLEDGSDIALISDAGTPLISDPGYRLVNAVRLAGIPVVPIPGASSVMAALSAAGLPTDSFHFIGFLSPKLTTRATQLAAAAKFDGTLVLFESGRRIEALLSQVAERFVKNQCVVAKELTKIHEQFLRGRAEDLRVQLHSDAALRKGEFVLLIDNAQKSAKVAVNQQEVTLLEILLDELSVKMAVKIATRLTGRKRNEIYEIALRLRAKGLPEISD